MWTEVLTCKQNPALCVSFVNTAFEQTRDSSDYRIKILSRKGQSTTIDPWILSEAIHKSGKLFKVCQWIRRYLHFLLYFNLWFWSNAIFLQCKSKLHEVAWRKSQVQSLDYKGQSTHELSTVLQLIRNLVITLRGFVMPFLPLIPQFRDICSFAVAITGQATKVDICYYKENK